MFAVMFLAACGSAPLPAPPKPQAPPPPPPPLVPVVFVDLDFDEASEDQADALTAALRSKLSASRHWRLDPSRPSLSSLLPTLTCPHPPDSACLDAISKQLGTDHYFWGYVKKAPVPDAVVAELHYWERGEAEHVALETYSSNLTDHTDDALRRVAARLVIHFGE